MIDVETDRQVGQVFPRIRLRHGLQPLLFLVPAVLLMAVFKILPILQAAIASTAMFDAGGRNPVYIGFGNYQYIFSNGAYANSLALTLLFAGAKVPIQLVAGLGLALLFRRRSFTSHFGRSLLVIPSYIAMPVVAILFAYIFDREIGVANATLRTFGQAPVGWLTESGPAKMVILGLSLWRDAGQTMLVFLAALTVIPQDLIESARTEGASETRIFLSITLPMLQRTVQFTTVLVTVASFQIVVPVWILTRGGPGSATNVASYAIYESMFQNFDSGVASAQSMILLLIIAIVIGLEMWWLRPRW